MMDMSKRLALVNENNLGCGVTYSGGLREHRLRLEAEGYSINDIASFPRL